MPLPPQFMKKSAPATKGAKPNPFAKGGMAKPMAKKPAAKKEPKGC